MNRITAKAILGELLEAYEAWAHGDYFYDHGSEVCEAVECILEQPRWISVEERLPEKAFLDKEIIVCKLNRFGGQLVYVTRFWGTHSALWNDITHWMPLPEPPEVEG